MNRRPVCLLLVAFALLAFAERCPAPLIFTPGEGWRYEKVGESGSWVRTRAKDQLEVAQQAFDAGEYSTAIKASRRTVSVWPFSDHAPQAQYLLGRCYEAKTQDEAAFKAYQKLIERYPKFPTTMKSSCARWRSPIVSWPDNGSGRSATSRSFHQWTRPSSSTSR
jgi:hypothetical protein